MVFDTADEARAEMLRLVRQALGLDDGTDPRDVFAAVRDHGDGMTPVSAYCTRHGTDFDWQIFKM